jgi:hypothetical protein
MKTLEKKVRDLNREILNLKSSHLLKSNMITFIGKFNYHPDWDNQNHYYEITYVEGNQPIITCPVFKDRFFESLLFLEPQGNKQIMIDIDATHYEGRSFILESTRQILSVRYIS